nr:MAG TPA: cysteine-rich protein [Caudoviricetes sp.]
MKCPECKLVEMLVTKVIDNTVYYQCKKCGKEIQKEVIEED